MGVILKPPFGSTFRRDHPIAKGCVGYWAMNEGGGSKVYDLSGYGNHGAFVAGSEPTWVTGDDGHQLYFNDKAIDLGDYVYDQCASALTIVARVMPTASAVTSRIIDKYPGPSIYGETTNEWGFYGSIGGTGRDRKWDWTWADNAWQTAAFRLGAGFQQLYVDGVLKVANLIGGPFSGAYDTGTTTNAYVGNRVSDMARQWVGNISWLQIYARALLPAEISELYADPFALIRPIRRYWMLGQVGGGEPSSLVCDTGVIETAGGILVPQLSFPAGSGSIEVSGGSATNDITLPAASGSIELTGGTAASEVSVACSGGSVEFTGGSCTFEISFPCATGSVEITGNEAVLSVSVPCGSAEIEYTGGEAVLDAPAPSELVCESGVLELSGGIATFGISVPGATGSTTLTGGEMVGVYSMACEAGEIEYEGGEVQYDGLANPRAAMHYYRMRRR